MSKHKHHGGAWKVAYADFVTAMMALFLVLWLTAQDTRIKEAVERAFRNPFSSVTKESVGIIPQQDATATRVEKGEFDSPSAVQLELLRRVTEDLAKLLQENPENQDTVKLELTPEGLRIQIFDQTHKPIFKPQTVEFTPYGDWVFSTLAWEISRYSTFIVELEGHTDTPKQPAVENYGPWELSADRANAARRKLVNYGVSAQQVAKVSGLSDTQPMPGKEPEAEINRRVTVLLKVRTGSRVETGSTEKPNTSSRS
jgi:chemotaxis protein MotB